jgi:hypothetical protein
MTTRNATTVCQTFFSVFPMLAPVLLWQLFMLAACGIAIADCLTIEIALVATGLTVGRFRALTELELHLSILPPLPVEGPRVMVVHPESANLQKAA